MRDLREMKLCCDCEHGIYSEHRGCVYCEKEELLPDNYIFGYSYVDCQEARPRCGNKHPKYFKRKTGKFKDGTPYEVVHQRCVEVKEDGTN